MVLVLLPCRTENPATMLPHVDLKLMSEPVCFLLLLIAKDI
jgi:hypothetical protein